MPATIDIGLYRHFSECMMLLLYFLAYLEDYSVETSVELSGPAMSAESLLQVVARITWRPAVTIRPTSCRSV